MITILALSIAATYDTKPSFMARYGLVIRSYTNTPVIAQSSINVLHNFSVKIDFDYRIGKMSFDKPKKKKSVKNEDLKDGGIENN